MQLIHSYLVLNLNLGYFSLLLAVTKSNYFRCRIIKNNLTLLVCQSNNFFTGYLKLVTHTGYNPENVETQLLIATCV